MKFFNSVIVASSLLASSAYGIGFGFDVGPFDMQFNALDSAYMTNNRTTLDGPICQAISNLQQLEIIVEGTEDVSSKEKKIVTKKLVVEPYAFGITRSGKPVLRGNVVSEKLVQEVTLKYGEDRFDEVDKAPKEKEKGYFSGMFNSDKVKNIDIRKVSEIQVVRGSHFDAPKDYKAITDKNIQVICELSTDDNEEE